MATQANSLAKDIEKGQVEGGPVDNDTENHVGEKGLSRSPSIKSKDSVDEMIVDWDGPTDPANPKK